MTRKHLFFTWLWLALLFCLAPLANGQTGWTALPQVGMARMDVGAPVSAMALSEQARMLAVGLGSSNTVVFLDLDSGAELKRITLPYPPLHMVFNPDGSQLFVKLESSSSMISIDTVQGTIRTPWPRVSPDAMAPFSSGNEFVLAVPRSIRRCVAGQHCGRAPSIRFVGTFGRANELALGLQDTRLMVAENATLVHVDTGAWSEISRQILNGSIVGLGWWNHGAQALAATQGQNGLSLADAGGVTAQLPLDATPTALAIDQAQDRAYVLSQSDQAVYRVHLLDKTLLGRYVLPSGATEVAYDPISKALYLAEAEGVVRLKPDEAQLADLPDPHKLLRDVAADEQGGRALSLRNEGDELNSLNLASMQAFTLPLGFDPDRLTVDPVRNLAIVAGRGDSRQIRFVDLSHNTPELLPESLNLSADVEGMAVDASRGLTVATTSDRNLLLVDNAQRNIVFNAPLLLPKASLGGYYGPVAVHSGQGVAYLLVEGGKAYARFDLVQRQIIDQRSLDFMPNGIAIDEAMNLAVLIGQEPARAYFLDISTQQLIGSLDLAIKPVSVAIQPDTHRAVVVSSVANNLSLIDLATRSLVGVAPIPPEPFDLAVSARFNQALVISEDQLGLNIVQLPNPVPVLTGLQPALVDAGSQGLTLKLTGEHFIDGAQVRFGQTTLPATWKSHGEVQVVLPAALLSNAGDVSVSVINPAPGGGESGLLTFAIRSSIPVLGTVTPTTLEASGLPQLLTLSGSNFLPDSKVVFGNNEIQPASISDSQISVSVPGELLQQPATVSVLVRKPSGGDSNALNVTIRALVPEIADLNPQSGAPGSIVTLTGRNFDQTIAGNRLRFTGTAQDAHLLAASATELKAVVPGDAQSGPLTLTTARGSAQSPVFSVQREQDFNLSVSPANINLLAGGGTSLNVLLGSQGNAAYTGLANLRINGLPAGVTARFDPPALSAGQVGSLILAAAPGATLGVYIPNVEATGAVSGGSRTVAAQLNLTVQGNTGETGIRGRFVTPEGMGIARVIVQDQVTGKETQSDAAGNFVLTGLQAGIAHLKMDATPANPLYPMWPNSVELVAGRITAFSDWIISPPPTDDKFTPLQQNAATDQVVKDARYPGLAVTIPAGTTIIGWDGVPKSRIAVERRTPDQLTVPLPPVPIKEAYHLYWGTPMGGLPSVPIPITLPNVTGLEPGEKTELWYYYGSPLGGVGEWRLAGPATVSADGESVAPDPGVGLSNFCGTCGLAALKCKPTDTGDPVSPEPDTNKTCNPIELLSGYEMPTLGGLRCGGLTPLEIGLAYHPVDAFQGRSGLEGAVGQGWVLDDDIVLVDANQQTDSKRLLLPPHSRINFARQADGGFTAEADPRFRGAVLKMAATGPRAWDLTFKDGARWHFGQCDPTGVTACFLLEKIDANGNVAAVTRRADHKISALGTGQRTYSLSYGASGYVEEIRDPAARTMRFSYNAGGRIETITDAEGGVTRFGYVGDDEHPAEPLCPQGTDGQRIKTIAYPGKATPTENFHGPSRRVLRQTRPDGRETRFEYQLAGACVTNVNQPGQLCQGPACPTLDSWDNYLAGWRIHGGQVIATTVIDGAGQRTTRRYNAAGLALEDRDPQGQKTTVKRDEKNRITETTDPLGRVTRTRFDAHSNPVLTTDPLGRQTYSEYDPLLNQPTLIRRWLDDGTAVTTQLAYDAKGNLKRVTDPENHTTAFTYTPQGQVETVTDPLGHETRLTYNAAGDLVSLTDPLNHTTRLTPDAVGRTMAITDPLTYTAKTQYNGLDQVIEETDPQGGLTQIHYDTAQRPQSLVNPRNNPIATWAYDDADRLVSRTDAHNQQDSYSYDPAGRLQSHTDRQGRSTTTAYDPGGRLSQVHYPDRSVSYQYDAAGRLIEITDGASRLAYTWDAADRLIREEQDSGSGATRIDYQYDTLDRRIQRSVASPDLPTADVTAYAWDQAGRLTRIDYRGQSTHYAWDAAGRLASKALPNGITQTYTWDAANRLTRLAYTQADGTAIEQIDYDYDATGRRIAQTHTGTTTAPETPFTASYDPADRMTGLTLHPGTAGEGVYTLAYDASGNLTGKSKADGSETTAYTWDASNRLMRIERTGAHALIAEFKYDALDRRIERTVTQGGVARTTRYLYDGQQALAEIVDGQTTTLLTGLMIDEAIARYGNGQQRTQLSDALGSVIALAKEDQSQATRYGYSPYGESSQTGEVSDNASQYTGRENDGTGLYFYRARYYDAVLKRFIAEDPIGVAGGVNTYSYVGGNPVSKIDPLGLMDFHWHGNWGGPGWGAGKYIPESRLTPKDFNVPALDSRDACYKEHDRCINRAQCKNPGNSITHCDHALASCLRTIPPWRPEYWFTDQWYPYNSSQESIFFDTLIPWFVH